METPRHFLSLLDYTAQELNAILQRASQLKQMQKNKEQHLPLTGKSLVMIFEKSSTRTRVSFEIAMYQLGGHTVFFSTRDTQIVRGETIEDSAKVLSRMADAIVFRTFGHERLLRFAEHSSTPVINGLTDRFHPCQLLADMLTFQEKRGSIQDHTVAWVGDGNNMCHSYINAAKQFDFKLRIACPSGFQPDATVLSTARDTVEIINSPQEAVRDATLIVTDVWTSMGQDDEHAERLKKFTAYQINSELMQLANKDALLMHCLPAHRGEEITAEVLDSNQSVVWEESENRLHAQKALLEFMLG